jgi:hypothetical protein
MLDAMTEPGKPSATAQDWIARWIAPGAGEVPSLLASSSGIMAIAAVYLYFTGYIFSLFYFRAFGVSLDSLDFSGQYFLVQSFWVFRKPLGWLLLAAIVAVAYGFAAGKIRREILLAVLILAFPALFFTSYYLARQNAVFKRLNPETVIHLQFKKGDQDGPADAASATPPATGITNTITPDQTLRQLNDSNPPELHMLIETKDRIVVFHQPASILPDEPPMVHVYTVLRSDLAWSLNSTQ